MTNAEPNFLNDDLFEYSENEDYSKFDYEKTKEKVDRLFEQYRNYKQKKNIIMKRNNKSLSFDNLGIYGCTISDPVGNSVEQLERYSKFIDTIEETIKLYSYQLTKDEEIIFYKKIISIFKDRDVMALLNMGSKKTFYKRIHSTYIKIARWFDLEVYIDDIFK